MLYQGLGPSNRSRMGQDIKTLLFRLRGQFQRRQLFDDAQVQLHAKVPIVSLRFITRSE